MPSNTVKRSWKEHRRGGTVVVTNKTINGIDNPYIGSLVTKYESEADSELKYGWYALGYLIETYGEQAIEEVAEMEEDQIEAFIGAIEDRLADNDDDAPDPRTALDKVMSED